MHPVGRPRDAVRSVWKPPKSPVLCRKARSSVSMQCTLLFHETITTLAHLLNPQGRPDCPEQRKGYLVVEWPAKRRQVHRRCLLPKGCPVLGGMKGAPWELPGPVKLVALEKKGRSGHRNNSIETYTNRHLPTQTCTGTHILTQRQTHMEFNKRSR